MNNRLLVRSFIIFALCFLSSFSAASSDVSSYINSLKTFSSHFSQKNPDGTFAEGSIYFQKPNKVRIQYDTDPRMVVIVSKELLIFHDLELEETSHIFIEKDSPVNFLFHLLDGVQDSDIQHLDAKLARMSVEYDDARYSVIFNKNPISIRSIKIDNDEGETLVTLKNTKSNLSINKKLFTEF